MSNFDAIEKGLIKHFLSFESEKSQDPEIIEILEPVGFDGADFEVKQESQRYGRDVSFAGGNAEYRFYNIPQLRGLNHQFDRLMQERSLYGFEALVKYILQYDGINYVIGELDFEAAKTNQIQYFECKVIQDTIEATIKRNLRTNVNVLSDKDVNGNDIDPLQSTKVLIEATPIKTISEWTQPQEYTIGHVQDRNTYFCLVPQIERSEINDTYSPPLKDFVNNTAFPTDNDADFVDVFELINAQNNLLNVTFNISDLTYDTNLPDGSGGLNFYYFIGENYDPSNVILVELPSSAQDFDISIPMGAIQRNQSLWAFFHVFRPNSDGSDDGVYTSCTWNVTVTSTSIDSVTESFRLIDLMKQTVKSITGAEVVSPEFDKGGDLYNQFLPLGNQLRNIDVESYDITMSEILDGIKEFDADYEVQADGTVYFGTRDTFYQDVEMDRFEIEPSQEFYQEVNPRFALNTFNFKYQKYERGQNDALENSREGIHTEAQFNLPNKRTSNPKNIALPWIRDPFMIEKIRRQGLIVTDDTSQENDQDKAIIDVKEITDPIVKTEGFQANHVIRNTTILEIINDGSFNWSVVGISVNDTVTLSGENAGVYVVGSFGKSNLQLVPVTPTPNPSFSGITYSSITYTITSAELVAATNQDFQAIIGTTEPDGFANMSFSISRNIRSYYGSLLRTACKYRSSEVINVTKFVYNDSFGAQKVGELFPIFEGVGILPLTLQRSILSTDISEAEVKCSFPRLWQLLQNIRAVRGYVTLIDNKGQEYKTHVQELSYNWSTNILTIKGEDRES